MGTASLVEGRCSDQAQRSFPTPNIRRFLVRKGRHRAARAGRCRQHHVGIGLSAHCGDLSAVVELCRRIVGRRAGGRAKKNVLWKCAQAVRGRVRDLDSSASPRNDTKNKLKWKNNSK